MGKKILITSIPCWNQRTGANTFSAIFEGIDKEDLANIYITPDRPDSDVCSRYFNIREWQVVRSVFHRNMVTGSEMHPEENSDADNLSKEQNLNKNFARKRRRIFLWLREIAWKLGKWNSQELNNFIENFNPDVLVFSIESYPYFNRLNEYIIRNYNPKKVVGYLWDDNFTYKQFPSSLFFKVERFFLRKQVKRLINLCTDVLAISPKMKKECDEEFGVDSVVLTKPLRKSYVAKYEFKGFPIRLLYTGSLSIGRDRVLLDLARAVHKINEHTELASLDIYTMTSMTHQYKSKIENCKLCTLHDGIPQSKVFREQENSDVLVFVESLDTKNQVARLSFSTKITDYISSKRCVFVIGQDDNASVEYFKEQDAAIVCSDLNQIYSFLKQIVECPDILTEYACKAELCGVKNHSLEVIHDTLCKVLEL